MSDTFDQTIEIGRTPVAPGRKAGDSLRRRAILLGGAALIVLSVAGFLRYQSSASSALPAPVSAVPVEVTTVQSRHIRIWSDFSGRMVAVDSADIRPEVGGRITEIRFKDGQNVKAGDVLFVIDPRPYEAAASKAEADLASAYSNAKLAKAEADRAETLFKQQALARDTYEERINASGVAQATIKSAQAALTQARLDIDHAYVKAPISGRVGRAEITVGNLVQTATNPPLLTSIVSADGIYADFDVDEQTYMKTVHAKAQTQSQEAHIPVQLTVQGDEGHVYQGMIHSFDNKIDTATGTIRARARFDNKDGSLVPGMFVSVRLGSNIGSDVLLVPDLAVGNDQAKRFVYVVTPNSKAAFREVNLGQEVDGQRVVLSGLHSGERVILDGLQRLQPDDLVQVRNSGKRQLAAN